MNVDLLAPPPPNGPVVIVGAGQSGLAAARALREQGQAALLLEAADQLGGAWPRQYDSLRLFSAAAYSAMPGLDFDGEPDRYPSRDEVAGYLRSYAELIGPGTRTGTRIGLGIVHAPAQANPPRTELVPGLADARRRTRRRPARRPPDVPGARRALGGVSTTHPGLVPLDSSTSAPSPRTRCGV